MLLSQTMAWGADGPIAVADIKRDGAIDFEKEVLPILRKKCLAQKKYLLIRAL